MAQVICEGSMYNNTRNCERRATWQAMDADGVWVTPNFACDQHLAQVCDLYTGGELSVKVVVERILTDEK